MRKTTSKLPPKEVTKGITLSLPAIVAEDLFSLVHTVGMHALQQLLEEERAGLCGPRYQHDKERLASRHGTVQGALVLGGRRVRVKRPRVRTGDGREVPLPTWERFSLQDPLDKRATEQMLVGDYVSPMGPTALAPKAQARAQADRWSPGPPSTATSRKCLSVARPHSALTQSSPRSEA